MIKEQIKEETIKLWKQVNRDGVDNLIKWLCSSDYFTAPASTKYHGAYEGGLAEHCLDVYYRMLSEVANEQAYANAHGYDGAYANSITPENIIITALGHDLCKVDFYTTATRNVKDEATNSWHKEPFYKVEEKLPYGHGEKSVYILQSFIRPLKREEALAIRFHMGDWSDMNTSRAYDICPMAVLLHTADEKASYLDANVRPEA